MTEREVHYLHNTDPEYDGPAAYCDYLAGRDEAPRVVTLSDARRDKVTCPLCLTSLAAKDRARYGMYDAALDAQRPQEG